MRIIFVLLLGTFTFGFNAIHAQDQSTDKSYIIEAAQEMINQSKYCVLITVDKTGHPQARTMENLPIEENLVSWFGTNKNSRKVDEINNDPRVTIHYGDTSGNGYVVITGTATIVEDDEAKEKHWLDHWDQFYPDKENTYSLIKVVPLTLEVVSYKHGLTGDSISWRAPHVNLSDKE